MNRIKEPILFLAMCFFIFAGIPGLAVQKDEEFNKIAKMNARELMVKTKEVMDKKYPQENWETYKFPKFVFVHEAVTLGYKISVKEPQLLASLPCYCLCDVMGHKNLLYCFLEKGVIGGNLDDHASTCNICITEAMRAFLWKNIGATEAEMLKALKEIYG
jgi:hypothetical protein